MRSYEACEWCGALTTARDRDGDAACLDGTGCAADRHAPKPVPGRGRKRGSRNLGPIEVRGVRRSLRAWAAALGIEPDSLRERAKSWFRSIEEEIEDRLAHGNPSRVSARARRAA